MNYIRTFVMNDNIIFEKPVLKLLILATKAFRLIVDDSSNFFNVLSNQYIEIEFTTGIKNINIRNEDRDDNSYIFQSLLKNGVTRK